MPAPEPRPEPREPARFQREIEPMSETEATVKCNYCKRRDGSHTPGCRYKGRKRKPVTRRGPRAGRRRAAGVPTTGALEGESEARTQVRQRLQDEINNTQAYVAELQRVLRSV